MGVLNVTPDSFSDGGSYCCVDLAVNKALDMIQEGADIIDVGGESSKPGASPVSVEEELARVIPVIKELRKKTDTCISIDTTKAEIMEAAVGEGATIINDISALNDKKTLNLAANLNVPICLMHMQGTPQSMQKAPFYRHGIIEEINSFFSKRIDTCLTAGIQKENLILDPGFGFGKTPQHNMEIVKSLATFSLYGMPLMIGASRKSTLGIILNTPVDKRLAGGLAIAVFASLHGVNIIRTHDIAETNQALTITQAIVTAP